MARGEPYVRLLGRAAGVAIWRVDGHRVRDMIDVEFTNGGHHYSRTYVPPDEIWLDRDAPAAREWPFWALHQLIERAAMAGGASYHSALARANRHERAERRRLLGAANGRVHRRRLGSAAGRQVWLVDGNAVRTRYFLDFTLGGHGLRYRFVPRREIWIDDAVAPAERPAILHHEVVEVGHMAAGLGYAAAHALASRAETRFRRRAEAVQYSIA
jgi:hypothetical protein